MTSVLCLNLFHTLLNDLTVSAWHFHSNRAYKGMVYTLTLCWSSEQGTLLWLLVFRTNETRCAIFLKWLWCCCRRYQKVGWM